VSGGAWLAAHDLAGLPGLPITVSGTRRWLRKKNVSSRKVPALGGPGGERTEWALAELPREARVGIAERAAAAASGAAEGAKLELRATLDARADTIVTEDSMRASAALADRAQQRMDAKLEILRALELFRQAGALGIKAAEPAFSVAYRKGDVQVAAWIRALFPEVAVRSLARWRSTLRAVGISGLAGNHGNRADDTLIERQILLRDFVIAMLVKYPHARATHVEKGIEARFADDDAIEMPSLRSIQKWIKRWRRKNAQTLCALANPDQWKNKYMMAVGNVSAGILRPNQLWELDSTPGDVMLTDGRFHVLGLVDVYPRRAKLLVSKTSTAAAVAQLVRKALLEFGTPEKVKIDNGQEYVSKHMERVLSSLAIDAERCPPFQPWLKPHVERFFGTFSRDMVELLAGFIGHNVAERKAIEARKSFAERLLKKDQVVEIKLSSAEFQKFCDDWVENIYKHNAHAGLDGRSPFQVAAAWPHPLRRIDNERALDILLAPAAGDDGWRVVQKKGLRIDEAWFIAPELEAYVGERVQCLELPDLGRVVVNGGAELKFLCIAECPERTGMDRKEVSEVAAHTRQRQNARVQADRRALKAVTNKVNVDNIVQEIMEQRALAAGKLALLPRASTAHESEGLTQAAAALAELHRPERSTSELMSDEQARAERARIAQLIPAGNDNELARRRMKSGGAEGEMQPVFENQYERVIWLFRRAKVRALTVEEQQFLAAYKSAQRTSYEQLQQMVDEQLASAVKDAPGEVGAA
jgi:putative transposase